MLVVGLGAMLRCSASCKLKRWSTAGRLETILSMLSEIVPALFTLAGSGLTGILSLAVTRAQRWQTKAQIESDESRRIFELRLEGYTEFLNAHRADLDDAYGQIVDMLAAPEKRKYDSARVAKGLDHGRQRVSSAYSVRLMGPPEVNRYLEEVEEAFLQYDRLYIRIRGMLYRDEDVTRDLSRDFEKQKIACHQLLQGFADGCYGLLNNPHGQGRSR